MSNVGRARNGFTDRPGPLDPKAEACRHGSAHGNAWRTDPDPFYLGDVCGKGAVFAVPLPVGVGQHVPVCPWHLARFIDAYEAAARSLRGRFALDRFTPDTALVTLADAPAELDVHGTTWERAGLDQEGRAHYHGRLAGSDSDTGDEQDGSSAGGRAMLSLTGWDLAESARTPLSEAATVTRLDEAGGFSDYARQVGQQVGWAAFDARVDRPGGGRA